MGSKLSSPEPPARSNPATTPSPKSLSPRIQQKTFKRKGITYSVEEGETKIISSLFQEIAYGRTPPSGSPSKILHEDSECVIFAALKGVSQTHLLVVPKRIIGSWIDLVKEEVGEEVAAGTSSTAPTLKGRKLLEHMVASANTFVSKDPTSPFHISNPKANLQAGFHTPPYNSIDHLHLHIIDRSKYIPSWKNYAKFPTILPVPWFMPLQSVFKRMR
ncbi:hypothetical protein TrCOL_g3303 [Triparma columacea]|uniref:HIT domain-containing protein n=1 Tax=Triparma columacea TaxID=722753 RepID=A0A9W7L841_9STRA|nr:hypothetical protein TrCOL_g3303 [Triparma columacea]